MVKYIHTKKIYIQSFQKKIRYKKSVFFNFFKKNSNNLDQQGYL